MEHEEDLILRIKTDLVLLKLKDVSCFELSFDDFDNQDSRLRHQDFLWMNGIPIHNIIDDTCCIDFSCCFPSLFWKEEKRKSYFYLKHGE